MPPCPVISDTPAADEEDNADLNEEQLRDTLDKEKLGLAVDEGEAEAGAGQDEADVADTEGAAEGESAE